MHPAMLPSDVPMSPLIGPCDGPTHMSPLALPATAPTPPPFALLPAAQWAPQPLVLTPAAMQWVRPAQAGAQKRKAASDEDGAVCGFQQPHAFLQGAKRVCLRV
eukprot:TRINITY_DN8941_c0_g2_i1.p6 TRINITY_DN8941_c0_g2~~TRINITY_DN8941_c0_g2_i1.p6  ORF type:complete len:104 (+),score=34.94 TRINITY_DN8941_c0_g2_i1:52-363(+)